MSSRAYLGLLVVAVAVLGGCQAPGGVLSTPAVMADLNYADLGVVLAAAVDEDGRLDAEALAKHRGALDRQLSILSVMGPTATPSLFQDVQGAPRVRQELAYWYNARTAWAMKLVLVAGEAKTLSRAQLEARVFPLDGRWMTLEEIDDVLAGDEDFRTVVAAPSVRQCRAPPATEPFAPGDIRKRIAERFSAYLDDADRFTLDVARREVPLNAVFWSVHRRAIDQYERRYGAQDAILVSALLSVVEGSPHRRLQDAMGYRTVKARRSGQLALQNK